MFSLSSATLASLTPAEKEAELAQLVEETKYANGSTSMYLKSRINDLEIRYEMSSDEMLRALAQGRQKETAEIATWLFLLDALTSHEARPE